MSRLEKKNNLLGVKSLSIACLSLITLIPQTLYALRAGDVAEELKIDYISNGPMDLIPKNVDKNKTKNLKILVLCRATGATSEGVLPLLEELKVRYPLVDILALTSDPKEQAKEFFAQLPEARFATAFDKTGQSVRKYMAGNMIYPFGFVINNEGNIIWSGEAIDLPEMLDDFYSNKFSASKAKKLAPLQEELQSRMRSGEERMADYTLRKILAIDPYNSAALRLRLFMLENTNRTTAAWNLVADQLQKYPQKAKFYLMQLDLAMRYSQFADQIKDIANLYLENIPANAINDSSLAWTLLTRMPLDANALEIAGKLVSRLNVTDKSLSSAESLSTKALYNSRIGKLDDAVKKQLESIEILKKLAPHRLTSANLLLNFYKTALKR